MRLREAPRDERPALKIKCILPQVMRGACPAAALRTRRAVMLPHYLLCAPPLPVLAVQRDQRDPAGRLDLVVGEAGHCRGHRRRAGGAPVGAVREVHRRPLRSGHPRLTTPISS